MLVADQSEVDRDDGTWVQRSSLGGNSKNTVDHVGKLASVAVDIGGKVPRFALADSSRQHRSNAVLSKEA